MLRQIIQEIISKSDINVNHHYLNRYISFCEIMILRNTNNVNEKFEKHHILPKAKDAFPEYRSFSVYPWNKVKLTKRQHLIAHWMVYKTFPSLKSQVYAYNQVNNKIKPRMSHKRIKMFQSDLYKCLAEDMSKKCMVRKTKSVFNTNTNEYYRLPIDSDLAEYEILKNKPLPKKPDYIKKYHDPSTEKEYWIDIRFPIPNSLVAGRSQSFKSQVSEKSKGNSSATGKKKYFDPKTNKSYLLEANSPLIQTLCLKKGHSPQTRKKLRDAKLRNNAAKGQNNPMFGKIRSDRWTEMRTIKDGIESIHKRRAEDHIKFAPRKLWNIGPITDDVLKTIFPRKHRSYQHLVGYEIITIPM